jgi:hypothetical protein
MNVNKKVAAADVVKEGKEILKECRIFRKEIGKPLNDDQHKELHKKMVEKHHDFASIYMLPMRSIVYTNEYFDDVMERYVTHLTKNPWNTRRVFLERQADYLVFTYRRKNPRHGSKDVSNYKENCIKQLMEEDDKMKEYEKEVKDTVEKEFDDIIEDRRKRIYQKLVEMKRIRESNETIDEEKNKEEVSILMKEIQDVEEMRKLLDPTDNIAQ